MAEHRKIPIPSSIQSLSWMEGRWMGTLDGQEIEEHWSRPNAGTIIGMFRWVRDGKVNFYELLAIEEEASGTAMKIKHFSPGLKGWEDKDEAIEFDLVQLDVMRAVWFKRGGQQAKWLIYERVEDKMEAWFETEESAGDKRFQYRMLA